MKSGKIIPNGVALEAHEYNTVLLFTKLGYDVELIPKSNRKGVRSPDVIMDKLRWEMKSPKGSGRWLMENTLQDAVKQSENIIVDLRRTKRPQDKCLRELAEKFKHSKNISKIKVITKAHRIIDLTR